ncbi:hypothetical protein KQX54_017741 [Cotesia glomerata]|uniref:Uncharacterized protein n=1 Tax=Cotesia glomerata TaxID=32391 RepID=A0AAV7J1A2_COTGL|nr:hypothetical protein KQX54_017741 [Cotesia glomerata]
MGSGVLLPGQELSAIQMENMRENGAEDNRANSTDTSQSRPDLRVLVLISLKASLCRSQARCWIVVATN